MCCGGWSVHVFVCVCCVCFCVYVCDTHTHTRARTHLSVYVHTVPLHCNTLDTLILGVLCTSMYVTVESFGREEV